MAAALLIASQAQAQSHWRFIPTMSLTGTYTDNLTLQSEPRARSQFVAAAAPGFSLVGNSRRLKVAATSTWHHFAYCDEGLRNTVDSQYQYAANAQGVLADDLLFFDASAAGGPRAASAFGPQLGSSSLYAMGNRVEVKTWRVSPYLVHRFGNSANLSLRYVRDSVDAGDRNLFGSSTGDTASLMLSSGSAYDTIGWGLSYQRQELDNRLTGESSAELASVNLSYRIDARLALTATAGYDSYDYQAMGGRNAGRNWSGGFVWTPSQRTRVQASLGRHYYGKTGSLAASHRSRHSVWSINYSDAITTTRSQFLLPATIDTASLLDRLFAATIPDPVQRRLAVQAYIEATGLPPSLADNINYLTNRYLRQKLLQATSAFHWSHSTAVLSAYASERTGLSNMASDSDLLGSQLATLNNNVRQRGARASYSYRFNSRSNVTLSGNYVRSRSIDTGIEDRQRVVRIGLTRRLGRDMQAAYEVRRRSGGTGAGTGREYRENAISASLSIQF